MPTIYTHAFVGLALADMLSPRRRPWPFWVRAGLLPILPDLDSFSLASYGTLAGHRGWTHTLAFAVLVGLGVAGATCRFLKIGFAPLFGICFLVTASHGLLDACNSGGYGIPLFWPLSTERFGPYGPIAVSDLGFELPDPRTSRAVRAELLYVWLPLGLLVGIVAGWRRWCRRQVQSTT